MNVSVIIPTIDEAALVGRAITSAQQAGADEVIVVDGGSADDTAGKAESLGARVLTAAPGRASQQNAGAFAAQGDVLLFLHADCQLPEFGLAEVCSRLAASGEIVGGCFRQHIEHPGRVFRLIEAGNLLRVRALKWAYGDQAIFVRRKIFRSLEGFPDLPLMEDLYFMKRLKRCGSLIVIRPKLRVSARRWKERGTARQTLQNWAMLLAVHLGVPPDRLARHYPRTT